MFISCFKKVSVSAMSYSEDDIAQGATETNDTDFSERVDIDKNLPAHYVIDENDNKLGYSIRSY